MLEVRDLHHYYGEIHSLKGISMEVRAGEIVTVIGSNGAGKTTTLRTISGLLKARSGSILFEGQPIEKLPPHQVAVRGIGHSLEGRHVFPDLTVLENLQMGAYSRKDGAEAVRRDIDRMYTLFPRLAERQRQNAGTLSGGEQQMLAMARALMQQPRLLLLDEPSLGLAPIIVEEIFDIIQTINRDGMPILLVEQNANMALSVAHRAYVMETGKIVLEGLADSLSNNPEVQHAYLGGGEGA